MLTILLLAVVLISGCQKQTAVDNSQILDNPEEECLRVDGQWIIFYDGCVDSCFKARSNKTVYCTLALQEGCDCGEDRCWNGKSCEEN